MSPSSAHWYGELVQTVPLVARALCGVWVLVQSRATMCLGCPQPYKVGTSTGSPHHLLFREVVIDASPIIINLSYDLMMRLSSFMTRASHGLSGANLYLLWCVCRQ